MLLDNTTFLFKKQVGFLRTASQYDIYNPETDEQIGTAKEEPVGLLKYLRLLVRRSLLPNLINFYDIEKQEAIFTVKTSSFCSKAYVFDESGNPVGSLKSKFFSGCFFYILDAHEREIGQIKGYLKFWDFKILSPHGKEIGIITKAWSGVGMENLNTSPHNFIVSVQDPIAHRPQVISTVLLAAGVVMDIVLSRKK